MGGLWGSRKNDDDDGQAGGSASNTEETGRAPDEHTRLLPNRVESSHYLSPDDPAVTPYNLWSVRIVRYLTVFLTLITFIWWVIQLVSMFVTPPGFHQRGGGFFAFSYASVTLANLLFTLIFFAIPSKAVRVLSIVMGFLLLLDTILLVAVQKTRHEEAWVGIASVVWAFLMAIWVLATDRLVLWGKHEEEERLTGRAETRRSLGEWTAVLLSTLAMVILTIALLLISLTLILRALDAGLTPPGKLYGVDDDKYLLHVYCRGNSTDSRGRKLPTVLMDATGPVEQGLWQFADNAIANKSISRYCFVDRPGLAWSDTAPSPSSAGMAVEVVSEALARAGEKGPWVLLGAGVGSIYSRIFSARHNDEIQGLVLIDPFHEDYLPQIGAAGRGFLLWIRGVLAPLGLDRLPGALFKGRTKEDRVWGQSAYQTGKHIYTKLQENLVAASLTKRDVTSSRAIQSKTTPLTIISSGDKVREDDEWEKKQRDLTHLTNKLQHWDIVDKAPHEVWNTLEGREIIEKRLNQIVYG